MSSSFTSYLWQFAICNLPPLLTPPAKEKQLAVGGERERIKPLTPKEVMCIMSCSYYEDAKDMPVTRVA